MTKRQAYDAMFEFLDQYWKLTGSEEIAALLGSMEMQADNLPLDTAMWHEWEVCCEKASVARVLARGEGAGN